ncbi:AraC family transcriptional regulator [Sodalis sp. RH15]|uniref:AraC family transcriptional regulator n=1 Tax=Sodalis sp. RH15 TaxID=3394330 RepID=UPI0039B431FC
MAAVPDPLRQKLIERLRVLTPAQGYTQTAISQVRLLRVDAPISHTPVLYDPCIVIVCQGKKIGFLGDREFIYDAQHYLVLSVPLPFTSQTVASPQEPLLALSIKLDLSYVAQLLLELETTSDVRAKPECMMSTPLNEDLADTVLRLLNALSTETEARILGPGLLRELYYRVLMGEQGLAMRAALTSRDHFGQIAGAIRTIHTGFSHRIEVSALAKTAAMSLPAFHMHFKRMTGTTPLQYLKSTRLHQARFLMVRSDMSAADASARVGYESPSQFNREFKRFFGHTPLHEAKRMRALLLVKARSFWPDDGFSA